MTVDDPVDAMTTSLLPELKTLGSLLLRARILKIMRGAENVEILLATPSIEIKTPARGGITVRALLAMCVSLSQLVASAEDRLGILFRALLSHTPNLAPANVTCDNAEVAATKSPFLVTVGVLENSSVENSLAIALLSTLSSKWRTLPREGELKHVTEVSLCHRVRAQPLRPIRAKGLGLTFEWYLPTI
jgi:hypothetical protein